MRNEFTAIIEAASEGGFFAYCPEIPGANGQGETIEECRQNLAEAIALILEDRREDGSTINYLSDHDQMDGYLSTFRERAEYRGLCFS